ncbi:MAG: ATP-binding protein [Polyangiaceae bacterium]|nr:ATP-binding protein [Polyangiaceae bacterium]
MTFGGGGATRASEPGEPGKTKAPAVRLFEGDDDESEAGAGLERGAQRPSESEAERGAQRPSESEAERGAQRPSESEAERATRRAGETDAAGDGGEGDEAARSWGGERPARSGGRGSLARRILLLFTLVLIACALTTAWSLYAQRRAAEESTLLRSGYVPLMLSLGAALETQNVVSAQLNHITDAKNPADARGWIETQRRLRPLSFAGVRGAAERGLSRRADRRARALGAEIAAEVGDIERFLGSDDSALGTLFDALGRGERPRAEEARDALLSREVEGARRLRELGRKVERAMDELVDAAVARERRAFEFLLGLSAGTLAVGLFTALYARRALAPLARVTARAEAVARGDLTPRPVEPSNDEIGELATTFEGMVGAIGRARRELVQAERLATVGRLAAQITHEIRNPISALGLNVELLEEEVAALPETGEARQLLAAIKGEVERLAQLSNRYLGLARRPRPDPQTGDVGDLVADVLRFVRPELERAGVRVTFERAAGSPDVRFDEAQIRQALLNLIRNAREAMPGGGELALGVAPSGEGGVEITIDDTGGGVPEEVRGSLFDPFFTTKKQGTGLGLAITREIVEAHGGAIACEGLAGGTRFRLRLPTC